MNPVVDDDMDDNLHLGPSSKPRYQKRVLENSQQSRERTLEAQTSTASSTVAIILIHTETTHTHTRAPWPVSMDAVYKPHMPVNLSYHLFRHFLVLLSIKSFSFLALLDRVH